MTFDRQDNPGSNASIHSTLSDSEVIETTPLLGSAELPKPNASKPSPWYIIIPVFLWAIATSSSLAAQLEFATKIFCNRYYQSNSGGMGGSLNDDGTIPIVDCAVPEVQSAVSQALAVISFLVFGCALVVSGYYGRLSDRKGRTVIVRVSMLGSILGLICLILTGKYQSVFGISLLYISPFFRGFLAGETILMASIQAYITDTTDASVRTLMFGRMMASVYFGFTIGPSLGSFIIKTTGSIYAVLYFVMGVYAFIGFYACIMPESNVFITENEDNNESNTACDGSGKKKYVSFLEQINVFAALTILSRTHSQHISRHALPILTAINTILTVILTPPVLLYAMLQFGWGAYEGGLFISLSSFVRLIILICLLPVLNTLFKKWCERKLSDDTHVANCSSTSAEIEEKRIYRAAMFDIWMVRSGTMIEVTGLILMGLSFNAFEFTSSAIIHGFGLITQPSLRSLLISSVNPTEVGELLGAISAVEAFAMMFSQLSINAIYSASVSTMPTLVFFACAGFAGLASLMAFLIHPTKEEVDVETSSKK
ncbi:major facilitator superfamily domain-containing protein [Phycomyces blakesleeanus]|uniref:Major facilitator superfamily (MFS) profile domain-containing protein n=2 Tax=Phycomyces blakesleeanus TaxID=4837 RepID=A0A162PYL5_PHYB8|nr:hypothetical protein PHYBLDRAFT_143707 [Phycomyces blakesleeanus NRRL 1555(-)]OAD75466.1 hypothetical protein PHYBLDRAFT_143707 [Phycomyces blakesleeanus NRRL 1555(-)]|eukprot:XP_018293506.1 hypothetical protein PHYBLDRAFT_143707 [Phycomyces blakesleeanus NRRL 1555(-)]